MPLSAKAGSFLAVDAVVGTNQSITGVGFQPKVVLFWVAGSNSGIDQTASLDTRGCWGYAVSSTDRGCVATINGDALPTMGTDVSIRSDGCILTINPTQVGRWDFVSMDADGFTIVVDVDPPASENRRVYYLALGGTDITNVKGGSFQKTGATGNQAVTGVGFQPDMMLFFGTGEGGPIPDEDPGARICFGAAKSAAQQQVLYGESEDGSANSITWNYQRFDECMFFRTNTGVDQRATFVSQDADGFTVNWLEGTATPVQLYLAIQGGSFHIGNSLTATSLTTVVTSGYGFAPTGVMVLSNLGTAQSTAGTAGSDLNWSVGAANSPTSRIAGSQNQQNGQATSDVWFGQELDEVYSNISGGAGIVGLMDVQSFDADGVTFVMDDADPTQRIFAYIGFGDAAAAGPEAGSLALLGVGA